VVYNDRQNEEGFLGLAFHPKYRTDGRVFVYYTRKPGNLSIVSSFRVSKDDPNKLDAGSETVLMQIPQPFWNHNGGTICFGPDGYLYIALGDGGAFNDPHDNAQNPMTWLGSILRIDVDSTVGGANYGIPKDNPFAGKSGGHPEVFAWGVRNPWRMAFDRKTGEGWFADVGQNLYEEICRLEKGGNYGWARRESFHPFGRFGMSPNEKMIEPIWEYHHDIGKSVTGGHVFRGGRLPELDGMYLYADYVSGKLWALKYDPAAKRVTANREIASKGLPILSYGEDEDGEVYLLTFSLKGQGIHRFVRKK
jgi:glucose/arabinose dehydrogenase